MGGGAMIRMLLLLPVAVITAFLSAPALAQELLIFGGSGHREFLGCLTCNEFFTNSVWNEFSSYGFKNDFGKWNGFGQHASQFSSTSACNEFASDPPVIVDRAGDFYGRLSVNEFKGGSVCSITSNAERLCRAIKVMCATK
jgi:hypothetical protein